MKLLRLPASKVHLGSPLLWNVRGEDTRLLLSKGQIIDSQAQLDALLQRGAFVDLEDAKAAEHLLVSQGTQDTPKRELNLFGKWDALPNELRKLIEGHQIATDITGEVLAFIQTVIDLVDKDVDIAIYHAVRQEGADLYFYGYSHSVQTSILCLLMARRLAWPETRTRSLMCAAMTMNIPTLVLQGQLAKQDVPVRESQKALIRQHPQDAHDWLVKRGVCDPDWLTAVLQHHERPDGSGYPHGLKEVSEMAVALRVTDVFMAKISPRLMRPALGIREAAKQLYGEDHGGPLSTAIIKEFGIYPPGEVVKLASGEIGIVMRRTAQTKCPLVAAVTDAAGQPVARTNQRDTSKPEHAVIGSVPVPKSIARLAPERIYGFASA